jgi:hypothetical protein
MGRRFLGAIKQPGAAQSKPSWQALRPRNKRKPPQGTG